jgi:hypothetical protein
MIGDIEKLLVKGQVVTMYVMGTPFEVTVQDTDISEYERRYLLSFSDSPEDVKWVTNVIVRQFKYQN